MFNLEEFQALSNFKRLGYLTEKTGLSAADVARIVDADESSVLTALNTGFVPQDVENASTLSEHLYLLYRIFSSLLRFDRYSGAELKRHMNETEEFKQCTEPPPWYPKSLQQYLFDEKARALDAASHWLSNH